MYKINVSDSFSAAHQLKGYEGPCRNVHGHTWKIRVGIICESTDDIGLSVDFNVVKKHLREVIAIFDHQFLNELDIFKSLNPTSENISRYIFGHLKESMMIPGCRLADVEVWESEKSSVIYSE
jgi:6-pyruvoyltetrahydropterin/6-carboxytetrahydropterin synthase